MSAGPPTDLLRAPPSDGLLEEIDDPLSSEARTRNRYRRVTASARTPNIDITPVISEDTPALSINRTRLSRAGSATVVGLANEAPAEGAPIYMSMANDRVFAGWITSSQRDDRGIVTVTAFDAKRALRRASFTGSYNAASIGVVVRDCCRQAGVPFDIDNEFFALSDQQMDGAEIPEGYQRLIEDTGQGVRSGTQTGSSGGRGEEDAERTYPTVTHDFDGTNAAKALDKLAQWSDAVWLVDQNNVTNFTKRPSVRNHNVNGILKPNAGSQTPPYRKVVIVGGGNASGSGGSGGGNRSDDRSGDGTGDGPQRSRPRASKNPVRGVAGNEDAPPAQTYRTRRPSITTQQTAQNIAHAVWREYRKQTARGTIELSGRHLVRPFDVITLPEYIADEQYLVNSVNHVVNEQDGFRTTVDCGGVA